MSDEKKPFPRIVLVCMTLGFLSLVGLPLIVAGLAIHHYKIERAQQKTAEAVAPANRVTDGQAK